MRCGSSPPCAPSSSTLEADNRLAERRTWPDLSLPSCVLVSIDEFFHAGTRGAVFCFKSGRHSSAVRLDAHGSLGARGSCLPHNGTYTGDPPSGLTTRGTFLGWKSIQEVRCEVESRIRVFRRSRWPEDLPGRPGARL